MESKPFLHWFFIKFDSQKKEKHDFAFKDIVQCIFHYIGLLLHSLTFS